MDPNKRGKLVSSECLITFRQSGSNLELEVSAPTLGPNGETYLRSMPQVSAEELDQLRAGNPSNALVEAITDRISSWLGTPDLNLSQVLRLTDPTPDTWRLVFSVRSVRDERIRFELANIPLELLTQPGTHIPYALHQRITSLVHLLPKAGSPPPSPPSTNWPLRILLVRSSPTDLLIPVPEAAPIRESIATIEALIAQRTQPLPSGPNKSRLIEVDILSRENAPDLAGPPTREKLLEQLAFRYDILVYLGHGDIAEAQPDRPPIGQLLLETSDRYNDPFNARQLSNLLQKHPVPVVLLVGCLTASENAPPEAQEEIPRWLYGSQAVAQALINGQSGVQFVVGMRYKIDAKDALLFLKAFFQSLLGALPGSNPATTAGNLELAVREARHQLEALGQHSLLSWAAPVVFRTLGSEPTFPFLASRPDLHRMNSQNQEIRTGLWVTLAEINASLRTPTPNTNIYTRIRDLLNKVDNEVITAAQAVAPVLMPRLTEIQPDTLTTPHNEIAVPLDLRGTLHIRELEGALVESSGSGRLLGLELAPACVTAGFDLLVSPPQNNRMKFLLRHDSGTPTLLPEGMILTAKLEIGPTIQVVYSLALADLRADPARSLYAGNNAIIVPPP